jgi:hypothetical protein
VRPFLRWLVNGRPRPLEPIVLTGEWTELDPRTDALKAMAAALEAQTAMLGTQALMLERFAVAAEMVVGVLERAEARALEAHERAVLEASPD